MNPSAFTARNLSQISCHSCHLLSRMPADHKGGHLECPRCGAALHQRNVDHVAQAGPTLRVKDVSPVDRDRLEPVGSLDRAAPGSLAAIVGGSPAGIRLLDRSAQDTRG